MSHGTFHKQYLFDIVDCGVPQWLRHSLGAWLDAIEALTMQNAPYNKSSRLFAESLMMSSTMPCR
jgi:hypothetical protein